MRKPHFCYTQLPAGLDPNKFLRSLRKTLIAEAACPCNKHMGANTWPP